MKAIIGILSFAGSVIQLVLGFSAGFVSAELKPLVVPSESRTLWWVTYLPRLAAGTHRRMSNTWHEIRVEIAHYRDKSEPASSRTRDYFNQNENAILGGTGLLCLSSLYGTLLFGEHMTLGWLAVIVVLTWSKALRAILCITGAFHVLR